MKRTPLKRKMPLRSSSSLARMGSLARKPMKRKTRRARPGLDHPDYLDFIRRQDCCACGRRAPSDPHHRPGAGEGLRSDDRDAIPMCRGLESNCHRDVELYQGQFKRWLSETSPKAARQAWHSEQVEKYRAAYARRAS